MHLSIIIINYNVKYYLEQCLYSVIKDCKNIDAEIIVVDNNSTDGTKAYFQNKFEQVIFIWNEKNVGFGSANNIGIKKATGEYLLLLNPDTLVGENCFVKAINFFKTNNNCGALGLRMIDGSGTFLKESKRGFPNTKTGFYKAIGLANIMPKNFGQYYASNLPEIEINKVDVLAGACMMLSRKAIEIVKGFDEDFFMYGEDIDLSYRIKKAGFDNFYLGNSTIVHFKGESTTEKTKQYFDNFYNAMKLFVEKHHRGNLCTKCILNIGIFLRKNFALLLNNNKKKEQKLEFENVLVIGNNIEISNAINLISTRCNTINQFDLNQLNFELRAIENEVIQNNISDIIFCVNNVGYKEIILCMQKLKPINFAFYNNLSNTIIGSNKSSKSGYYITA